MIGTNALCAAKQLIQSVKRGVARWLANTVPKVEDRTWRGKHQVRTPVHERMNSIAENRGAVKAICRGCIASGLSQVEDDTVELVFALRTS